MRVLRSYRNDLRSIRTLPHRWMRSEMCISPQGQYRLVLSRKQLDHGALMSSLNFGFHRAALGLTARMGRGDTACDTSGSNAGENPS